MAELKIYNMDNTSLHDMCNNNFYRKSEADKVIAEKDAEITRHKYRRCLDNAWWCRKLSNAYTWDACNHRGWKIAEYYDKKAEFYRKWRGRWITIAEKFKETE